MAESLILWTTLQNKPCVLHLKGNSSTSFLIHLNSLLSICNVSGVPDMAGNRHVYFCRQARHTLNMIHWIESITKPLYHSINNNTIRKAGVKSTNKFKNLGYT